MAFFVVIFALCLILLFFTKHKIGIRIYVAAEYGYALVEVRFWGILVAKVRFYITKSGLFWVLGNFEPKKINLKNHRSSDKNIQKPKRSANILKRIFGATEVCEISADVFLGTTDSAKTAIILGTFLSLCEIAERFLNVKISKNAVRAGSDKLFLDLNVGIKLSLWNIIRGEDKKCHKTSPKSSKIPLTPSNLE